MYAEERELPEEIQQAARAHGGECLSKTFRYKRDKLVWKCASGHTWEASAKHVVYDKKTTWCPHCRVYLTEKKCKFIAEFLTGEDFLSTYIPIENDPIFAKRFQLDCYCKELKVAIEHNGKHHYVRNIRFQRTEEDFKRQLIKDARKIELCHIMGIKLLVVPYWVSENGDNILENFILDNFDSFGIHSINRKVDFSNFYANSPLESMKQLAKYRGGECLSENYVTAHKKLEWKCSEGHFWKATAASVKSGTWCLICGIEKTRAARILHTIEEMQQIAKSRGGKCLSTEYKTNKIKLKWECKYGHQWEALSDSVIGQETWCPYCIGRHKNIEYLQELAAKKNGKCLATELKRVDYKVEWQCEKGHIWSASPTNIRKGRWCPLCNKYSKNKKMYSAGGV